MKFMNSDRGQSVVELALTLPIIVFSLLGGADLARAYALQLAVQNGARGGAEAAAITQAPTEQLAVGRARDEMSRTPGMDVDDLTNPLVTAVFAKPDGTECANPPSALDPCFVTVRVRFTFRTITPWPLVPNTASFDRQTVFRTIARP